MYEFVKGALFGVFVILLVQAGLLYHLLLLINTKRIIPVEDGDGYEKQQDHPEAISPWPQNITDKITNWLKPLDIDIHHQQEYPMALSPTTECDWLNAILHRLFLSLRSSSYFRKKWADQVCEKLNAKLVGNSFVSRLEITDLYLGDYAPRLTGIRLAKGVTSDFAVVGSLM